LDWVVAKLKDCFVGGLLLLWCIYIYIYIHMSRPCQHIYIYIYICLARNSRLGRTNPWTSGQVLDACMWALPFDERTWAASRQENNQLRRQSHKITSSSCVKIKHLNYLAHGGSCIFVFIYVHVHCRPNPTKTKLPSFPCHICLPLMCVAILIQSYKDIFLNYFWKLDYADSLCEKK